MSRVRLLAALALVLLPACAGELQTPGEALRIFGDSLPQAFLGEPYEAQVRAVGGLRPFAYELEEGALPPGLALDAGVIRGVPTETGSFEFTVAVSDANLSRTFQEYTLAVVERPPPTLTLVAPETEVRSPVTVRLRVTNASELRALSALLSWDEAQFELLEGSVETTVDAAAILWQSEPGSVHIEMSALGRPWNGELTLAQLTLVPSETAVLRPRLEALFLDDREGSHFQGAPTGAPAGAAREAAEGNGEDTIDDPQEDVGEDEDPTDEPADGEEGE